MNETIATPTEAEFDRLRKVDQLTAEEGVGWQARFASGTFGCHEFLDRTALLARMVEEAILNHPACSLDAEWYALADRAVTALNDLYQKVGSADPAEA